MPWCNGRFRLAVRLHFHGFRETTGCGIRVESRIRLARLRNCRHDRGIILSVDWPFDRPGRASTDHSSVHDGVWLRCRFAGSLAPWIVAVLLTCFVIGVVGNGAAHLAYARSISTWFDRRLGTAFAFVMVGAGLGRSGWRSAYVSLGVLALLLGLPLSWRYIVERGPAQRESAPVAHSGLTWRQGTRSFPFWIIVAVLFVSSISMNGAITHLSALLTDRGISPWHAALCASILGGSSVLGRIGTGWLLDRFFGARVAFVVSLVTAAGIFILARANTFAAGSSASALIGVGAGGEAAITPYLLTRYFGLRAFSTLYGLTWTFYAAAGAAGPVILGRAFDSTGSYAFLLTILAGVLSVAAATNLLLPKYPATSG